MKERIHDKKCNQCSNGYFYNSNRQLLLFCKNMSPCEVKMFSWCLTCCGLKVRCQKPKINMSSESVVACLGLKQTLQDIIGLVF